MPEEFGAPERLNIGIENDQRRSVEQTVNAAIRHTRKQPRFRTKACKTGDISQPESTCAGLPQLKREIAPVFGLSLERERVTT